MTTRKIAFAGVLGALYAAVTIFLHPISYGPIQLRVAEALMVLPFFFPYSVWGLFVGVIVANLFSPYGVLDIVCRFLLAKITSLCTMRLGLINRDSFKLKALACAPAVVINALVIGAVIAWAQTSGGPAFWPAVVVNGGWVGLGQLVVLYALGLPILVLLPRTSFEKILRVR